MFWFRVPHLVSLFSRNAYSSDTPQSLKLAATHKLWEAAATISRRGLSIKPTRPNAFQTGSIRSTTSPAAVGLDLCGITHYQCETNGQNVRDKKAYTTFSSRCAVEKCSSLKTVSKIVIIQRRCAIICA